MKKVKRVIAALLSCSLLLSACSSATDNNNSIIEQETHVTQTDVKPDTGSASNETQDDKTTAEPTVGNETAVDNSDDPAGDELIPDFYGMNDPALLQYIEDTVYAGLVSEFSSEDYVIENVDAIYMLLFSQ